MFALNLLSGVATAALAFFSLYYIGKILDGYQNKDRTYDLWFPASIVGGFGAYWFFFGFNLTHGILASAGLALFVSVPGTLTIVALAWLISTTFDKLLKFGDKLKSWARTKSTKNESKNVVLPPEIQAILDDPSLTPAKAQLEDTQLRKLLRELPDFNRALPADDLNRREKIFTDSDKN